jgi:glutamate-1-semialdehyde aminotransferase
MANERIAFCNSGSDAILLAMRAARAFTGKDRVGVFAGACHGLHDTGLAGGRVGAHLPDSASYGTGIPKAVDETVQVLPYGHPAAFDLIRLHRAHLAAVIVEPVRVLDPHLDAGPWLCELAELCRKADVLLILDETVTGFRLAFGGAQERLGVSADLVVYGQTIGGGLPLGVVAGRAPYMRSFSQDLDTQGIYTAHPFAGNALAVAASAAFLTHAASARATLYPALEHATSALRTAFNGAAARLGVTAEMRQAGSMFRIVLGPSCARPADPAPMHAASNAFAIHALNGGVLLLPGLRGYMSTAHATAQITRAGEIFTTVLADLKADGVFARLDAAAKPLGRA